MHQYALAIGWPVPLLEKILSSSDIAEAMAYDRIDPFGNKRSDLQAGIVASVIANANRPKHGKAFTPQDFIARFDKAEKTNEVQTQILEALHIGDISKPGH